MTHQSLEEALQAAESPVEMLRNSQTGPYAFPGTAEFTNWRDEQRAWRETCVLFEQSFHMTDLYIEGPDALRLLSDFGINNFENFEVNKAKQFVACNHDGYVIGDAILFYLDEDRFNLVGRPTAHNWVHYQAETSGYDVTLERDERLAANPAGRRKLFRYQVQGPNALELLEEVTGGPLPEIKFFNMTEFTIVGQAITPYVMEWQDNPVTNCSVLGSTPTRSETPLSKLVTRMGYDRWVPGLTLPTPWNLDGFHRPVRRFTIALR